MDAADVLAKLYERGNALQAFWGFYITVAVGIIAFFGAVRRRPPTPLAALISVAFVGFAFVNGSGIYDVARQREALFAMLSLPAGRTSLQAKSASPEALIDTLLEASRPLSPIEYAAFHGAVDVTVLVSIWYLTLARWNDPEPSRAADRERPETA